MAPRTSYGALAEREGKSPDSSITLLFRPIIVYSRALCTMSCTKNMYPGAIIECFLKNRTDIPS